ncbi:MAG: hypothetical protein BWX96_01067 [Bacteroidetes bacterium ADurb.Bin145]|jgi:hypothetical protein|nr:MAG: hypothetical protein BWX96_01067 [Bacteroidetes bacterium ADurb.Bin145]
MNSPFERDVINGATVQRCNGTTAKRKEIYFKGKNDKEHSYIGQKPG